MTFLRLLWKAATSRPLLVAAAFVAGLMVVGHCKDWREQQRLETQPQVLEQTKKAKKAHRRRLTREQAAELCSGLTPEAVYAKPDQGRKVWKDRLSTPASAEAVLGELDDKPFDGAISGALLDTLKIEKLPHGGEVAVTLVAGEAVPTLTLTPNPRPWLEGMSRWRLSALVGAPIDGGGSGVLVVPRIDWTGLRTGRIDYGASATYCPARSVIVGAGVGFE